MRCYSRFLWFPSVNNERWNFLSTRNLLSSVQRWMIRKLMFIYMKYIRSIMFSEILHKIFINFHASSLFLNLVFEMDASSKVWCQLIYLGGLLYLGKHLLSSILHDWVLCYAMLSHFSHVRLCVTPETAAHQAPLSLRFSRQEHWSGLSFPSPMHESEKWKWSHSVMSDSSQPHGLQPTRLFRPWDFPGRVLE